ncbi:MAG: peptidase S51 [Clostridiales bacterium]|nr:peptidase S51 [Clostridiales bacterium]
MKKLFLTSVFAKTAKEFKKFYGETNGKSAVLIPTAAKAEGGNSIYIKRQRRALEKLGIKACVLDISVAESNEITAKLLNSDIIYIGGGNTFYLLQELKESGADKLIKKQVLLGKAYIGESAGAVVAAPYIDYIEDMDKRDAAPNLSDCSALGLVDFYPLPHMNSFPFKKASRKIAGKYSNSLPIKAMTNNQAICVCNNEIKIIGK